MTKSTPSRANTANPAKSKTIASPRPNSNKKPGFAIKGSVKMSPKKPANPAVIHVVAGPPGTRTEFYFMWRDTNDRTDMYTRGIDNYMRASVEGSIPEEHRHERFENAAFLKMYFRRVPNTDNVVMTDEGTSWWRRCLLRDVSEQPGGQSTMDSRREGCRILETLFHDQHWFRYQPRNGFVHRDMTGPNSLVIPMNKSLMDSDIEEILRMQYNEDDLNGNFYTRFNELAPMIWDHNNYSIPAFAVQLGYPNIQN